MRISEKIRSVEKEEDFYFSFEFFPPHTPNGLKHLYQRIDKFAMLNPLFVDVTWGYGGSTKEHTLAICSYAIKCLGLDVLLHLTCAGC